MLTNSSEPLKLFYCYAHEDKALRDELDAHLSGMKRQKLVQVWYDREISAGQEWKHEIDKNLSTADIILLLISARFLASDYCYSIEMQKALQRHAEGTARVVPIILRPVDWEGEPFSNLQVLPTGAIPVTRWPDRDDAFEDIANELSRVVNDLRVALRTKEGLEFADAWENANQSKNITIRPPQEQTNTFLPSPGMQALPPPPPAYQGQGNPYGAGLVGATQKAPREKEPTEQPQGTELSLFAIARTKLEDDDRAIVGNIYTVEAGVSQHRPDDFYGQRFRLRVQDPTAPLPFDILLHVSENVILLGSWYQRLTYNPRSLQPQLLSCSFRLRTAGKSYILVNFYRERQWLKTIRFEFESIEKPVLSSSHKS